MRKNNLKFFSYLLITVFLTLGLSISFQSLLAAWVAPTANPPNNNVDEPINKSGSLQIKSGPLYVNSGITDPTGFVAYGNAGVGTTTPYARLSITGTNALVGTIGFVMADNNNVIKYAVRNNGTAYYGTYNAPVSAPAQAIFGEYRNSGVGWPSMIGNWESTGLWGLGANTGTADNIIRIGKTDSVNSTWSADQSAIKLAVGSSIFGTSVGIGTINPGVKLDVRAAAGGGHTNIANFINPDANFQTYMYIGQSLASGRAGGLNFIDNSDGVSGGLALFINGDNPAAGAGLFVKKGGNVGISTTNPAEKLEVNGNIKLSGASATYKITNVANPTVAQDVATKAYVDAASGGGTKTMYLTSATFTGDHNCDNVPANCCASGYHFCDTNEFANGGRRLETTGAGRDPAPMKTGFLGGWIDYKIEPNALKNCGFFNGLGRWEVYQLYGPQRGKTAYFGANGDTAGYGDDLCMVPDPVWCCSD